MREITATAIRKFNISELKVELAKRGFSINGKKDELSKRLIEVIGRNSNQENNSDDDDTTLSNKENLRSLIKEVLNEEFTKQEVKITNLKNSNFQTTMAEIKKSQDDIKDLKKEINDFKTSLEFTESELQEKIENLGERHESICKQVDEIYEYQNEIDPEYINNKLTDLEDRSRRNNLRIYGITETNDEIWEKCEEHADQVFSQKLGLKNIRIERAHCAKRKKGDKSKKPRPIVCNLLSFKDKKLILKNANKLKGTNLFIDEDYSFETMEYRKQLWDEVKYLRSQGNIAYLNYQSIVNKGMRKNINTNE